MDQSPSRLAYLFGQYAGDRYTETERLELIHLVRMSENADELNSLIETEIEGTTADKIIPEERADQIFNQILMAKERVETPVIKIFTWRRIAAAAILIGILAAGSYFVFFNRTKQPIAQAQQKRFTNDVAPGGNKAILTLADGKQILLDSAANGTITQQGNTKIVKLDSGQLAYRQGTVPPLGGQGLGEAGAGFNTITTPKGGQYQIVLADGSKVWLNAASSLKYPTAFTGKQRIVELTGEGYFEVAHDGAKPFTVAVNGVEVIDLGTAFNINAYDDEATITTTLLEGSVKVSKASTSKMIKPGEQAQIENHGNPLIPKIMVQTADVDEAVAWKNGEFHFESADLKTILRQFARWYDVEVVYEGTVKNRKFFGVVKRSSSLSKVLEMLQDNNIIFSIEGKKLVVKSG